jgi:succinate-semialdehyde dehydrogenase/glutarate-semialdehyde dehydrogenase
MCAPSLKHVSLELGGNDPLIIFDDCDFELAVSETIGGRIGNAGQTCCASKRFIVQKSIKDKFTAELVKRLAQLKIGDPSDPAVEMGPVISERAAKQVEQQIQHTVGQGAKLVCGGTRNGAFIAPTVLEVSPDMDIARDMEVFGPVFPIIPFETMEEAIQIANNTIYGLSSGVITENIRQAMKVANSVQAGACIINGTGNYRLAHQPFGGYNMSGLGREGAVCTLEEMTRQKMISFKGILK